MFKFSTGTLEAQSKDHSRTCKRDTEKENRSKHQEALLLHQHGHLENTFILWEALIHENTVST